MRKALRSTPTQAHQSSIPSTVLLWVRRILSLLLLVSVSGCASLYTVGKAYNDRASGQSAKARPVLLILVDGLSQHQLDEAMPVLHSISKHFEVRGQAHAPFPSLTFPSVASLLTQKPVSKTGFIGNVLETEEGRISFGKAIDRQKFSELVRGQTVFAALDQTAEGSVSFDYGLGLDATVSSYEYDLTSVVDIRKGNYLAADRRQIRSAQFLLSATPTEELPKITFLHLVGLDFVAHEKGAASSAAKDYLRSLDAALSPLLQTAARLGMVTILTSDHGFQKKTQYYLDMETVAAAVDPTAKVLNESRYASVFLTQKKALNREKLLTAFKSQLTISVLAFREKESLIVWRRSGEVRLEYRDSSLCAKADFQTRGPDLVWRCPEEMQGSADEAQPFLLKNLSHFFAAKNHPDLLILPNADTAFTETYEGFHGGAERDEVLVPLLLKNAELKSATVPALWDVLDFLTPAGALSSK